jgi:glycosyltransferase involved in cell wall biosynthesis
LKELVLSEKDMEKNNLSVVISVHNGEAHLAECLSSLSDVASEIIVVDHDSTDNTSAIAKTYNVTLYHEKNNPQKIDIQKNFGFSKATKEWILSLDADEEVTPELAKELKTLLSMHKEVVAYEFCMLDGLQIINFDFLKTEKGNLKKSMSMNLFR